MLQRGRIEPRVARLVFEFHRDICVEIYSALVSLGLELSSHSHRFLAELCRCTPYLFDLPCAGITTVDATSPDQSGNYICSLEIIKVELYIRFVALAELQTSGSDAV